MSLEKYFRDELDYLRELGKQISIEKPHISNFLSEKSSDPDVERLLEGFAFLTGTLKAKIEDEFPEFTHSMIDMLWPDYLRPTPSMTIVEFNPNEDVAKSQELISKGMYLFSKPIETSYVDEYSNVINEGSLQCTFQTCRDLWLNPFSISDIELFNTDNKSVICIDFKSDNELSVSELDLNKLQFFLGADNYTNQQLYLWLNNYLDSVELVVGDKFYQLPNVSFSPVGFKQEESVLPYSPNSSLAYRVLYEYFCYPDSFSFLDIVGFSKLSSDQSCSEFSLRFSFSRPLPSDTKVRKSALRLHCVPAINLFEHDSENIVLDGSKSEYLIKGSHQHPEWYETFAINKVASFVQNQSNKRGKINSNERVYVPFESFQHQFEYHKGRTVLYYKTKPKTSLFSPGFDYYISFVRGDEELILDTNECVSINMVCTNRDLPTSLKIGDICIGGRYAPSSFTFSNITRPSLPLHPIMDGTLTWKLISSSSLNYLSILNIDTLREILKTYDLPAWHSHRHSRISQKKLDAIKSIETRPLDRLFKGVSIRGLQSTLYVSQSGFESEGELFLLGSVLANFFSLYSSINSFHKLKIINIETQEVFEWPIQLGQKSLM